MLPLTSTGSRGAQPVAVFNLLPNYSAVLDADVLSAHKRKKNRSLIVRVFLPHRFFCLRFCNDGLWKKKLCSTCPESKFRVRLSLDWFDDLFDFWVFFPVKYAQFHLVSVHKWCISELDSSYTVDGCSSPKAMHNLTTINDMIGKPFPSHSLIVHLFIKQMHSYFPCMHIFSYTWCN